MGNAESGPEGPPEVLGDARALSPGGTRPADSTPEHLTGRRAIEELLRAELAAHTIQRRWRAYVLRMDALDMVDELRRRRAVFEVLARLETNAARLIQRAARQRVVHTTQTASAVKLQAVMRGAAARRQHSRELQAVRLRKLEHESRVAVLLASGPHRFAMKIQGCVRQWLALLAEERAEAEARLAEAAERAKAQEAFRKKVEERKLKEEEQRKLRERRAEAEFLRDQYHRKTLMALPVRKRSRRWPHGWEPRELSIDLERRRLVWQRPDSMAVANSLKRHFIELDSVQSVSLLDGKLGTFAVAVHTRFYEFRAPCAEALDAWISTLAPYAADYVATEVDAAVAEASATAERSFSQSSSAAATAATAGTAAAAGAARTAAAGTAAVSFGADHSPRTAKVASALAAAEASLGAEEREAEEHAAIMVQALFRGGNTRKKSVSAPDAPPATDDPPPRSAELSAQPILDRIPVASSSAQLPPVPLSPENSAMHSLKGEETVAASRPRQQRGASDVNGSRGLSLAECHDLYMGPAQRTSDGSPSPQQRGWSTKQPPPGISPTPSEVYAASEWYDGPHSPARKQEDPNASASMVTASSSPGDDGAGALGPLSPLTPSSASLSPSSRMRRQSSKTRLQNMQHASMGQRRECLVVKSSDGPLGLGLAFSPDSGSHSADSPPSSGGERSGRAVIVGVVKGSAAAAASLTPYVFLTAIDGRSTEGGTLSTLQGLIRSSIMVNGQVRLEVAEAIIPSTVDSAPGD